MKIIQNDQIVCFDCDDTLVMWNSPAEVRQAALDFDNYGCIEKLVPNYRMIDCLKRNFEQGRYIIVWTQNGYQWAKEVVNKLNIKKYVHKIQCKPYLVFDDIAPQEFMKRAYLHPDYLDERYKLKVLKEES